MARFPHPCREVAVKRLFAFALLVLALGGCFGSKENPVKVASPQPSAYLVSSTPQAVLVNMIKSYSERDSTHYKGCFDPAYQGQSYDGSDANGYQAATYSFDDEAAHISALQRSTTVYHVSLDLPNYAAAPRESNPGDPAGWATIHIYNPHVQIDDVTGSVVMASGEVFEFKFAPTLDAASPTDTTWAIVQWTEIAPAGP